MAGGRPLPPEILALSDLPLLKAASFDTFCLVALQPQEIEKEVHLHLKIFVLIFDCEIPRGFGEIKVYTFGVSYFNGRG